MPYRRGRVHRIAMKPRPRHPSIKYHFRDLDATLSSYLAFLHVRAVKRYPLDTSSGRNVSDKVVAGLFHAVIMRRSNAKSPGSHAWLSVGSARNVFSGYLGRLKTTLLVHFTGSCKSMHTHGTSSRFVTFRHQMIFIAIYVNKCCISGKEMVYGFPFSCPHKNLKSTDGVYLLIT